MKMIITILLAMILVSLNGTPVDRVTAEKAAKNWLSGINKAGSYQTVSDHIVISDAVHIFNFKYGGFALIAADDASTPVLGYSADGRFESGHERSNIDFWLGMYIKAVNEIRSEKLSNAETVIQWKKVLDNDISPKNGKAVTPLLTSTWNQSPLYNNYCPLDGGSLSVVGCVATAMSQIMYYHKYPAVGKSSHSYTELGQFLEVDYYLSRYNWDKMPNALSGGSTAEQIHEVAQISYHAGVAVEMMYGSDASGAYSEDVPYALETYFKYNLSASHVYRSSYTAQGWRTMLQGQLDAGLPVYYSGQGDGGGHAFVCDGYQDSDFYHFNWGWGGSADGYYSIDNLNPGGYTFNDYQAVVKDIVPKTPEITFVNPIPDIQTNENSYQINLNDHFSGNQITYSIDPKSSIDGLQYSITDSILTLNRLSDGISKIIVTCTTRNDNSFDEFYFKFGSGSLMAAFGNAYDFGKVSYMDAGTSSALNAMQNISFSTWVKLNSNNVEHGLVSKSSSSNTGWSVIVQSNNLLKFSVKTQDGITRRIYSLTALQPDIWYHLDFVYDGKDLMIYINGDLDNIKTSYTASSPMLHDESATLKVGFSNGVYLDGIIDETVLWNQPISIDTIRGIMRSEPDVASESLVSYWPFTEGFYDYTEDMAELHDGAFVSGDLSYWISSEAPVYFFAEKNTAISSFLLGDDDPSALYEITSPPVSGTAVLTDAATGAFDYTPAAEFEGIAEFKYTITYGATTSPEKTALINVKEGNSIEEDISGIAEGFELYGNYPNPFNPETTVSFNLDRDMNINLIVFDTAGRIVSVLEKGFKKAGSHSVQWNGKDKNGRQMASGVYYFRLSSDTGGSKISKAMMLK
ncbi:MAG TPA: C10 family peptidase [Clostridiales bacterium]|nr:C10 family peptidase [Clostridiales bacterium]